MPRSRQSSSLLSFSGRGWLGFPVGDNLIHLLPVLVLVVVLLGDLKGRSHLPCSSAGAESARVSEPYHSQQRTRPAPEALCRLNTRSRRTGPLRLEVIPMTGPSKRVREITLRFLAAPTDISIYGKVHGGAVMKWIDEAGYICAAGWSGYPCATVYVGGIRFHKPIQIGNIVEVHAQLIYTGRTSMHIAVKGAQWRSEDSSVYPDDSLCDCVRGVG